MSDDRYCPNCKHQDNDSRRDMSRDSLTSGHRRSGDSLNDSRGDRESLRSGHYRSDRRDSGPRRSSEETLRVTLRGGGNFPSYAEGEEQFEYRPEGSSESLTVKVGHIDMPDDIFERVLAFTVRYENDESVLWAREVKREMDKIYEPIWNVFIGGDFGVFTTYQKGLFAHFWVHGTEVVVYKTFGIQN